MLISLNTLRLKSSNSPGEKYSAKCIFFALSESFELYLKAFIGIYFKILSTNSRVFELHERFDRIIVLFRDQYDFDKYCCLQFQRT